jgi:translation initiation factor IF-2
LDKLEEAIVLQAELMGLRGDDNGPAEGIVVESRMERGRGCVPPQPACVCVCVCLLTATRSNIATVLVQRGTVRVGSVLVAGDTWARVRTLAVAGGGGSDSSDDVTGAGPSVPVEIGGWRDLPPAGSEVLEAASEVRPAHMQPSHAGSAHTPLSVHTHAPTRTHTHPHAHPRTQTHTHTHVHIYVMFVLHGTQAVAKEVMEARAAAVRGSADAATASTIAGRQARARSLYEQARELEAARRRVRGTVTGHARTVESQR